MRSVLQRRRAGIPKGGRRPRRAGLPGCFSFLSEAEHPASGARSSLSTPRWSLFRSRVATHPLLVAGRIVSCADLAAGEFPRAVYQLQWETSDIAEILPNNCVVAGRTHSISCRSANEQRFDQGPFRPAGARPAHLGHGPLQFPMPLLHAGGGLRARVPVRPAGRHPQLRGDRAACPDRGAPGHPEGPLDGR